MKKIATVVGTALLITGSIAIAADKSNFQLFLPPIIHLLLSSSPSPAPSGSIYCIDCHDGNGVTGEPYLNPTTGLISAFYTPQTEPDGTMKNEHHYYYETRPRTCSSCHVAMCNLPAANDPNCTSIATCVNCHNSENLIGSFDYHRTKHDMTNVPQPALCLNCHEGNVFDEHSGRTQFVADQSDLKCSLCHFSNNQTVKNIVTSGGGHAGGMTYCDDCHISLSGTGTHGQSHTDNIAFDVEGIDCTTSGCHVQDVVLEHFDSGWTCSTCHAGETLDSDPAVVQGVILNGTNITCASCHGADRHHTSPNAAAGNCEYCHADPRPGAQGSPWDAVAPGDSGSASGVNVPTQMACRQCHVKFDGTNMNVYKFTRSDYLSYALDYSKTVVHTIPNTINQINNYGICFDCHGGGGTMDAPSVSIWHARPDQHNSWWQFDVWVWNDMEKRCDGSYGNPSGVFRSGVGSYGDFLPGRGSGTISAFNLFQDPGFGYIPGSLFAYPCSNWYKYTTSPYSFTRISIPAVPGNGNTSGSVPVFPSICPRTPEGEVCPTQ
ncbi:MAG: hypothetical protein M8353_08715 [ANME-2 cluster archaeon]|nr:hypothetical protein [ANME-2 cluster archaeon]